LRGTYACCITHDGSLAPCCRDKTMRLYPLVCCLLLLALVGLTEGGKIKHNKTKLDQYDIETDSVVVDVKGGADLPEFNIRIVNSTTVYTAKIQTAYQTSGIGDFTKQGKIKDTEAKLKQLNWNFTDYNVTEGPTGTEHISWDIISTGYEGKREEEYIPDFKFTVNIASSASYIKFDTILSNMTWHSEAVGYVICYKLKMKEKDKEEKEADGLKSETKKKKTKIDFGNASFVNPNPTAMDSTGATINVTLEPEDGSPHACMMYSKFNGTMTHDPLLGVGVTDEDLATYDSPAPTTTAQSPATTTLTSFASRPMPSLIWTLLLAVPAVAVRWG